MKIAIDESRTARVRLALSLKGGCAGHPSLALWLQSWSSVFLAEARDLKIPEDTNS
jgi:hypothetical protein